MFTFWKKKGNSKSRKKYDKEQHPNAKLKKISIINSADEKTQTAKNGISEINLSKNIMETIDLEDAPKNELSPVSSKITIKGIKELTPTSRRNNYTQVRISPAGLRKEAAITEVSESDQTKPKIVKLTLKMTEEPKQVEYINAAENKNLNVMPMSTNNLQIRRHEKNMKQCPLTDAKLLNIHVEEKESHGSESDISPPKPKRTFAHNNINYYYSSSGNKLPRTVIEKNVCETPNVETATTKNFSAYRENNLNLNSRKTDSLKRSMNNDGQLPIGFDLICGTNPKKYKSTLNTVLVQPEIVIIPTAPLESDVCAENTLLCMSENIKRNKNQSVLDCKPNIEHCKTVNFKTKLIPVKDKHSLKIPTHDDNISVTSSNESLCVKLKSCGIKTSTGFVGKKIYKFGERGSGTKSQSQIQDFEKLRDECLDRGVLFEDPDFLPNDSSLFFSKRPDRRFDWLRPGEIVNDPRLFVEGFSRFDVQQGELGDCWLLAAVANLTLSRKLFFQIVPDDQNFQDKYAGIFHFRFWQYGRWVDVVIDDRLPTYRGQLVFLHSSEANEFWSALLEKAYAKLHGSYEALKGGSTCEAMEDFTGGVTEMYELNNSPPNLYKILLKAFERNSLMGCSIEPDPNVLEAETPQGLIRGHAYSITRVTYVDIQTPNSTGKIPLIRLRNPWGNEAEWNGAWSDKSPEWRFIPDHEKEELGLTFDDDGEFWMSFRDFQKYFDRLEICNLSPDSLTDEDIDLGKKKWEMSVFEGDWVRGVTAGGCRNYLDTFWHNPQYRITLTEVDDDDDDNKCTVIVALMQKNRRALRNTGADCLTIGFAIYYLPDPDRAPKPLDLNFFKYNASVARSPSFINLREVSCRFKLPPGTYCIVPSTFEPHEEAEFLLRVFSENQNNMEENDEDVGTCNMDDRVIQPPPKVTDVPQPPPQADDKVREFFLRLAGDDMEVDWMELKEILDYAMRNELPAYKRIDDDSGVGVINDNGSDCGSLLMSLLAAICSVACKDTPLANMFSQNETSVPPNQPDGIIETQNKGFSKDVCRSMIAMMDKDGSGKLGFEEFKVMWIDIRNWKAVFKLYDKDQTGVLSAFELRQALNSAGYKLNNHILGTLVHRYGTRDGYIAFDDFIMCAVKLKTMIDNPDEYNRFMNEGAQLSYGGYGYNYT